jgi:hypothetical protein
MAHEALNRRVLMDQLRIQSEMRLADQIDGLILVKCRAARSIEQPGDSGPVQRLP